MGIVIINGKRYDSVTGLMLSDRRDELELASSETDRLNRTDRTNKADRVSQVKPKVDDTPPVWVGSYIDSSSEDGQVEGDTGEAITVRQVKAQPDTTKAPERRSDGKDWTRSNRLSRTRSRRWTSRSQGW